MVYIFNEYAIIKYLYKLRKYYSLFNVLEIMFLIGLTSFFIIKYSHFFVVKYIEYVHYKSHLLVFCLTDIAGADPGFILDGCKV